MGQSVAYAYLKTIDGEEVMEFKHEEFEKALTTLHFREVKKSDRVLYFVSENAHFYRINFFKGDYFELLN
ncbi:MAG: hypothetical protein KU28_09915 [Sulfurovum sp. PC08-66]|jgi:hypothetical protein|nr:MAG: hypothetical protein KU28_09915 [Sulfurovum sp. PC08-66]